jgi:hypothetical protein
MEISNKLDSVSAFVERKLESSIPSSSDYRDLWEQVICPTIQNKYVTIRCNLTNDIRTTYKDKFGNKCLLFVRMISQALFVNATEDPNWNKVDPDILANAPDIMKDGVYDSWEGMCDGYTAMSSFVRR